MKLLFPHLKLYALLLAALFLFAHTAAPARAQHEGHDMSKMPGMSKPKPKARPKPKTAAARKRRPAQVKPKQDEANEADEAEASEPAATPEAAPAVSTESQPPPAEVHKHEAASPAAETTP